MRRYRSTTSPSGSIKNEVLKKRSGHSGSASNWLPPMCSPSVRANACRGSVTGPGTGWQALSSHSATDSPLGGPWNANSGSTASAGTGSASMERSIMWMARLRLPSMISQASRLLVTWRAGRLRICMHVARQGPIIRLLPTRLRTRLSYVPRISRTEPADGDTAASRGGRGGRS